MLRKLAEKARLARMDSTMSRVVHLPHELVPPLGPGLEGLHEQVLVPIRLSLHILTYVRLFFSTSPKKLNDEKTQNSRKKLKTQGKN